jgi:hypothetical protein
VVCLALAEQKSIKHVERSSEGPLMQSPTLVKSKKYPASEKQTLAQGTHQGLWGRIRKSLLSLMFDQRTKERPIGVRQIHRNLEDLKEPQKEEAHTKNREAKPILLPKTSVSIPKTVESKKTSLPSFQPKAAPSPCVFSSQVPMMFQDFRFITSPTPQAPTHISTPK